MSNDILNASDDEDSPSDSKMNKTLLNSMHRRRMSCTLSVQQLWDAVKVARYQRQIASNERIIKYMSRVHNISQDEVNRQVGYCLRDGLLLVQKKKANKGSKQGTEQEGYKLPETPDRDMHDWYCFECHRGGDVVFCAGCHRVYHLSCINNLPNSRAKYLCPVCIMCEKPEVLDVRIKRLNRLIAMTCNMLKERYGCLYSPTEMLRRPITIGTVGAQLDIGDEGWRVDFLIHRGMDLSRMVSKAKDRQYSHLGEFIADAKTIVHNVVIFHGVHSRMADDARRMLRDCQTEVMEIRTCHQCYHSSRAKTSRHWFCRPCVPSHQLVYAKTSPTAAYCPGKVLVVDGSKYEVRFFGGNHERAKVEIANCLPISTNVNHFEVIRTPSWTKACEELKRHQDMLVKGPPSDSSSSSEDDEEDEDRYKRSKRQKTSILSSESKMEDDDEDSDAGDEDNSAELPILPSPQERKDDDWDEDDEPLDSRLRTSRTISDTDRSSARTESVSSVSPAKRKRGRPPKSAKSTPENPRASLSSSPSSSSRPRPRIHVKPRATATPAPTTPASSSPRKRGRPRGSLNKKTLEVLKAKNQETKEKEQIKNEEEEVEAEKNPDPDPDPDPVEEEEQQQLKKEEKLDEEEKEEPPEEEEKEDHQEEEEEEEEVKKVETVKPESPSSSSKSFDPKKNEEEIVSSSCTEPQFRSIGIQTKHNGSIIQQLEDEVEELKTSHSEQIKQLQAVHIQEITVTKKKQWCYNCEQEAIYHCCWNTAYCSTECQQVHWQREHKRVCRRKR